MEQDLQLLLRYYPLLLTVIGFIIGLGAVTVIDLHGFLGQHSPYWTDATVKTHKVTKPLIWVGTVVVLVGVLLSHVLLWDWRYFYLQLFFIALLVANGCFLSFVVSPYLLKKEREGKSDQLLPRPLQLKISISFIVSALGWWGLVVLFLLYISSHLSL